MVRLTTQPELPSFKYRIYQPELAIPELLPAGAESGAIQIEKKFFMNQNFN